MNNELLKKYSELVVRIGINVQKGQKIVINCPVECADFARLMVTAAYDAGASDVFLNWRDDYISRERWLKADESVFDNVYPWDSDKRLTLAEKGAGFISVSASNPENLRGVDRKRLEASEAAASKDEKLKRARQLLMNNSCPWTVVSVPIPSWAKKVFPNDNEDIAMEKLWAAIYNAVRIKEDEDPVRAWEKHCNELEKHASELTSYQFKCVRYKNSLGTDLTVELPSDHLWIAGGDTAKSGVRFVANMPTEEVFCAPKKDGVNGVLYSSKPLTLYGNVIEGIRLEFKDGRITDVQADKGKDILESAINTDEGSHYLGEIALVPYDSPISNSGILFYNTLFDENASCHFAFGEAYSTCIKGGENKTVDELKKCGINAESAMHVDFMVGTSDLSIIGETHDGKEIEIFRDGNFCI